MKNKSRRAGWFLLPIALLLFIVTNATQGAATLIRLLTRQAHNFLKRYGWYRTVSHEVRVFIRGITHGV